MTVLEAIQRSSEYLGRKGVDSPRLNAELLLAHVVGVARMKLYLDFARVLEPEQVEALRVRVVRRGKREPLQQITGTACFCGLEFAVSPQVLTPRPETELLAELGWKKLGEFQAEQDGRRTAEGGQECPRSALDFGTGSGCLGITLAVKCPTATITAIDISSTAIELSRANARRHGVESRVTFVQSDRFASLNTNLKFDLIVANPPYVPSAEIAGLQPEVRDFEPKLALDGGADGLDFYRRLAEESREYLRSTGEMVMEFGDGQAPAIAEIFRAQNWVVEAPTDDYTGRPRILAVRNAIESQDKTTKDRH